MFNKLKALTRTTKSDIKALKRTGLFMAGWYEKQYPEVKNSKLSPIEHYVRIGDKKGYNPNPYFDTAVYQKRYKASLHFPGPTPVHYAKVGWKKGRYPSDRFSPSLYLKYYPKVAEKGVEPLKHFLRTGRNKGHIAFHRRFERDEFAHQADDMHLIAQSGLFRENWYKNHHTDLWYYTDDLLMHYVTKGAKEGRSPNPFFNTVWYRQTYAEEVGSQNPLAYYIREGMQKGHQPGPDFCPDTYLEDNDDIREKGLDPLAHYINQGLKEKRPFPRAGNKSLESKEVDASATLPMESGFRALIEHEPKPLAPASTAYNPKALNIHWVIPDFAAGGGGHMTIFRIIHHLELAGHKQVIWLHNPTMHKSAEAAYETIIKHFQHFSGQVKLVDESFVEASGDALIATDCWTVWPALSADRFIRRFYFVQDFEPSFHPMGASYLAAEATYKEDLDCICASPWLASLMQGKYGRWAKPFWLAADKNIYRPKEKTTPNPVPRIALYARHFTSRRAVELAMLALEVLAKRGVAFEVDFFGSRLGFRTAPFKFVDHSVASPEKLAEIFQEADIGVVFSATNYSLVPQEMMACHLPIVELDGESTRAIFPEDTVTLAKPNPVDIADKIATLIADPAKRAAQAKAAFKWVDQFSWPASAHMVEEAIQNRLADFGEPEEGAEADTPIKASVVIPTLNAGPVLDKVLAAATTQKAPWPYEILVIDSGSTDETLNTVAKYPSVKLHQIDKKDFDHGDTRNLGAELTSGEFIAFLTHDALPANDRWLFNLVTAIEHYPNAAGAFGKHLAWPEASAYTRRDLNAHFDMCATQPLYLHKDTNKQRFDTGDQKWHQLLHFYSDNNSCMRRSVWEKIPYRRTKFGEDQIWADDIIKAGYGKVYATRAVVYHSHDFDADETFERNKTESAFFRHFFGYELIKDEEALEKNLKGLNKHDRKWGEKEGLSEEDIELRCTLNEARLKGYLAGCQSNTEGMF